MLDIHAHILPDLDDGPAEMKDSIALARAAFKAGTEILVATPHVLNSMDMNRNMIILNRYREFQRELETEVPGLKLLLGSEIYFRPNLSDLVQYEVATINNTGCYMLVEFSLLDLPKGYERELKNLQKHGIIPIVAHPERNVMALKRPSLIGSMIEAGALIQLNAGSVTGSFGRRVKKLAHYLLKRGWVHFIASDAHSLNHRGPDLQAAVSVAANLIGVAAASRLVLDHPQIVVEGLPWPGKESLVSIAGGMK